VVGRYVFFKPGRNAANNKNSKNKSLATKVRSERFVFGLNYRDSRI
jgi:hypothetical protein